MLFVLFFTETFILFLFENIAYFVDNLILTREGSMIYLQDYYKVIAENSIADNIAVKIHKTGEAILKCLEKRTITKGENGVI